MLDLVLPRKERTKSHELAPLLPLNVRDLIYDIGGLRIIDHLDLNIQASGCTAILGYNGAGKSVLLRLLHGLLKPTSGEISWSDSRRPEEIAQRQSMVFQTPVLLRRSVEANVRYALTKRGFKSSARTKRLETILEETNLVSIRQRNATVLSGGERQRVAVARALAVEPDVIFLDEPTASLDPAATIAIEQILQTAIAQGRKLIMATHSVGQAERLASDIVFMHRGTVAEHRPIKDFLNSPQSEAASAFIEGRLIR